KTDVFFFSSRRRHTRSKRDWSSDVCSSDLKEDVLPFYYLNLFTQNIVRHPSGSEGGASGRVCRAGERVCRASESGSRASESGSRASGGDSCASETVSRANGSGSCASGV